MTDVLVRAEQVSKRFQLHRNFTRSIKERALGVFDARRRMTTTDHWAVRDVTVTVSRGEAVGLVGANGSGKSTLLKLVAGILRPTGGRMLVRQDLRIGTMIELGAGFHPELSGRENVYLNASVYGLQRDEVVAIYDAVVDYAELAAFMHEPVKNLSSGMAMRLAFAVAVHIDADVLLLDEVFAVGDAAFRAKCRATLARLAAAGQSIVLVSHDAQAVASLCQRVCVLRAGRLVFDGPVTEGLAAYASQAAATP